MNILLIGGTGNISADCAAELSARGHDITVVSRGRSAVPPADRVALADRKDRAALRAAVATIPVDVVINFLGFDIPDLEIDHAVFAGRIKQYIFISSATVYAKPHRQLPLTEGAPVGNEFSEYAQRKLACEQWLRERADFPATIVRPSHTYSRRWFPNVVSSDGYTFAARLLAGRPVFVPDDGESLWTLTTTTDFAVGLAGLAGNERALGETFHVTSDEALSWNEIYRTTATAVGAPPPRIVPIPTEFVCAKFPQLRGGLQGDKSHPGVFDNSKIKRFAPGFHCEKSFRAGIEESATWHARHPAARTINAAADALFDAVIAAWETRS